MSARRPHKGGKQQALFFGVHCFGVPLHAQHKGRIFPFNSLNNAVGAVRRNRKTLPQLCDCLMMEGIDGDAFFAPKRGKQAVFQRQDAVRTMWTGSLLAVLER